MIQLSSQFCIQNRMFIISDDNQTVKIGCGLIENSSTEQRTILGITKIYPGHVVVIKRLEEPDLMRGISIAISDKNTTSKILTENTNVQTNKYEISTIDSGAPVITILNSLLLEAEKKHASDIHFELFKNELRVRYRINGILILSHTILGSVGKNLSARIKLMANLNTLENRKPQDGRFSVYTENILHDIRVSIIQGTSGESIVLRFLNGGNTSKNKVPDIKDLGVCEKLITELKTIATMPDGLVLITGPTGSGKTTTLAALVSESNPKNKKIISIEDPVEYQIEGVVQVQTNENLGLNFSTLLRRILRQDPDVIMIGEIRDSETAELAIRAALTGHLVLSSLHTRHASEAKNRLIDLGIPEYLVLAVLRKVIGQRLLQSINNDADTAGWNSRIPVMEIIDDIRSNTNISTTLRSQAENLVREKKVTQDEVERVFGKE